MTNPVINVETRFVGLPVSGGLALARVCLFNDNRHNNLSLLNATGKGPNSEKARLRQAVQIATERIDTLIQDVAARIGQAEAEIFKVHKMIINDASVVEQIQREIEQQDINAERAIVQVLGNHESRLLEVDNPFIKERATDIAEVRRRLLDVLGNTNPALKCSNEVHCQKGRDRIIVAEELTASLTTEVDTKQAMGFVTERGGPTSHAAILAQSLGIPAISGIKNIHSLLSCGTELLINGDTGEVIVWPSDETIARFRKGHRFEHPSPAPVEPIAGMTVMANISRAAEIGDAIHMKAEGVGLYRTEFEFLAAGRVLGEDEQFELYASVVKAMPGRPVYFRLLDIGADKEAPFLDLPREGNPYLGFRGSRLLLARTDLLQGQARALARVSAFGPVYALYPMIVDLDQFMELKRRFCEAVADLPSEQIRHGLMFEVPSACLQAEELLKAADFASIGTNDLIQYLFAVDRNNELVAHDYTPDKPVFWRLIGSIQSAAAKTGRHLSVCGEAAGNPRFLSKLMEMGIRSVSVSPRMIPEARGTAFAHTAAKELA